MNAGADRDDGPVGGERVRYIRRRNRLKDKAGAMGRTPGAIPAELLARAENAFKAAAESYPEIVQEQLATLLGTCERAVAKPAGERDEDFARIAALAHEIKGQGGTFGYPLITSFADSLYKFTGGDASHGDEYVQIVRAHVDAIRAVVAGRIAGDGGATGRELQEVLQAAIRRYAKPARPGPSGPERAR